MKMMKKKWRLEVLTQNLKMVGHPELLKLSGVSICVQLSQSVYRFMPFKKK